MYLLAAPKMHLGILTEGGSGGHMDHPFDLDWVTSGKDLLDFFTVKIPRYFDEGNTASVKTDGVNVSFKLVSSTGVTGDIKREFAVDRGSKKPIDITGITVDRIGERFAEGHGMRDAVLNLLTILNNALENGNIQEELEILGMWDDPNLFLNTEYVLETEDKPTMNVIKYDENFIAIHGVNEFFEKPSPSGRTMQRKSRIASTNKTTMQALDSLVRKIRGFSREFNIYGPNDVIATPKGGAVNINYDQALGTKISIKISENNEKTDTLGGWLRNAGVKNPYDSKIVTSDNRKIYALHKDVYFSIIIDKVPISVFLGTKETDKVQMAIDTMNGAIFWHATRLLGNAVLDAFYAPLGRQGARDHEGLVLSSKEVFGTNKPVKLTGDFIESGAFGRISQLVATDQTIQSKDEVPTSAAHGIVRKVAIVPGAFKAPHKGHLEMVKHYSSLADMVYIFISRLARGGTQKEAKVTFDQSKSIWKVYLEAEGYTPDQVRVIERPSKENSPVRMAYEFTINEKDEDELAQKGDMILLGASVKLDKRGNPDWMRFRDAEKYVRDGAFIDNVEANASPSFFDDLSGTAFRKALLKADLDELRDFLPVSVIERGLEEEILSILNIEPEPAVDDEINVPTTFGADELTSVVTELVKEILSEKKKRRPTYHEMDALQGGSGSSPAQEEAEGLEEISSSSGVGGGAGLEGGGGQRKVGEDEEPSLIREEEPVEEEKDCAEKDVVIEQVLNYLLQHEGPRHA